MHLNRLLLEDFAQHEHLEVALDIGLTGILGPVGCGKSNIVRALKLLLTGQVHDRALSDYIRWGCQEAHLALEFEIGGTPCTVERIIREETGTLSMQIGDKKFGSAAKGYACLYDLLETTPDMMSKIVFADQGALGEFLFGASSRRKDVFSRLFGTSDAEKARGILQEELAYTPATDSAQDLADAEEYFQAMGASLRGIQVEQEAIGEVDQLRLDYCQQAVSAREQREQDCKNLRQELTEVASLEADKQKLDGATSKLTNLLAEVQALGATEQAAKRVQELWKQQERIRTDKAALATEEDRLTARVRTLLPESQVPPELRGDVAAYRIHASHLANRLKMLAVFGDRPMAACPVCKYTPKQQETSRCPICRQTLGGERRQELLSELPALRQEAGTAQQQLESFDSRLQKILQTAAVVHDAVMRVEELKAEKGKLAGVRLLSAHERDAADTLLQDLTLARAGVKTTTEQVDTLRDSVQKDQQRKDRIEKRLFELESTRIAGYNDLSLELTALREKGRRLEGLKGQAQQARQTIQRAEQRVSSLKSRVRNDQSRQDYRQCLEQGRHLLHRDNLPSAAIRSTVQAVNSALIENATAFELGFSAWIDPSTLSPVFLSAGATPRKAEVFLSGGERTSLAFCFHVALWKLFLPRIAMLVMDEPTQFLDGEHIAAMANLLGLVRSYCRETQSQVLLVTHNERLKAALDQAIEL